MAARGVHDAAFRVLQAHTGTPQGICVVDIGAGMGAFSRRLLTAGYSVLACDLYPEFFRVPEITCLPVTLSGELPYAEHSADVAVALELFEHIDGHETLLNEIHRVLKPGGTLLLTTPNILNLKSRISFLMTGFLYNFPPLDPEIQDPVHQHISPFSLDRYRWRLRQSGFELGSVSVDRYRLSSRIWAFLIPLIRLVTWRAARRSSGVRMQNMTRILLGRILILCATRS